MSENHLNYAYSLAYPHFEMLFSKSSLTHRRSSPNLHDGEAFICYKPTFLSSSFLSFLSFFLHIFSLAIRLLLGFAPILISIISLFRQKARSENRAAK